jgi:hypothetical protein
MLNVKFNIVLGSTMILLSLLCLLINKFTIVNFETYLNISKELSVVLNTKLIDNFIFQQIEANSTCNGISFPISSELNYCFKINYSEMTYYNYLKEETIENECNMFDSLGNRIYISHCLNSYFYDVQGSNSKIVINNEYFPIYFNNDTFTILNEDMFNVTIYDEDIYFTQVPEITYRVLPGVNRQCINDKIITKLTFQKLYNNINNYKDSRSKTSYFPFIAMILCITFVLNILLLKNYCENFFKRLNLAIVLFDLLLEYLSFLYFMDIYFKSFKISDFAFLSLEGKCLDSKITENFLKLLVDSKLIHNTTLVVILIIFTKIVLLLYLLKTLIILNLIEKKPNSRAITPKGKSSTMSLKMELLEKRNINYSI